MKERVWLGGCPDYDPARLFARVDQAFGALHVYDQLKPGMTVVLKPNLVMASKPEEAIITHPALTAAVGKCVRKAGAKVLIAESPGGPYTPALIKRHYAACGYQAMAEELGFALYTDCKSREVSLPQGERCRRVSLIEPFLDRDFLINLPKLKTHGMVGYSGAVKNLFGAVPGLRKPELHCRFPEKEDFSQMLVDICAFLEPDLSILDGIWAMEGDGPTGGSRRQVGVLAASASPYALDVCGAALTGSGAGKILTLKLAGERGLGPSFLDEVEVLGEPIEAYAVKDFLPAKASGTDFIDRLPAFLRPAAKKLATPYPKIDGKACVGCGKCAQSCPQHTIRMVGGRARVDLKNCIRCFCCHEMCPKHVVRVRRLRMFDL